MENLKETYNYLKETNNVEALVNTAAKNIRIELKRKYPNVKFSVKLEKFSGGNSIDIKYTDGPCYAEIVELTRKYQKGCFDGSSDMYELNLTYLFVHRAYTETVHLILTI